MKQVLGSKGFSELLFPLVHFLLRRLSDGEEETPANESRHSKVAMLRKNDTVSDS